MGRGSQKPQRNVFYYAIKSKDMESPMFVKSSDKYNYLDESRLSGHLVKIEPKTFKYTKGKQELEGHVIELELYSEDENEIYSINVGWNGLGRSLINCLLGLPRPFSGPIEISLYTNKDGYPSVSVWENGQLSGFAFPYSEYKDLIYQAEDPLTGKMVNVYKKVNAMFKKEMEKHLVPAAKENSVKLSGLMSGAVVDSTPNEVAESPKDNKEPSKTPKQKVMDSEDDDLPF